MTDRATIMMVVLAFFSVGCRSATHETPLGVLAYEDPPAAARAPVGAFVVRFVWPESPASKAGIQAHDIIVSVRGQSISSRDLIGQQWNAETDGCTEFVVRRDGGDVALPCVRHFSTPGLSPRAISDAADVVAPLVIVKGAVNYPGTYDRDSNIERILAGAAPREPKRVCVSTTGPTDKIAPRVCGELSDIKHWFPERPGVSYEVEVGSDVATCGVLSDVALAEIRLSSTARDTAVFSTSGRESVAAIVGMRVGSECAELTEVGLVCVRFRQGEREHRMCRVGADGGT